MNLPDSSSLADRAESALAACGVEWPAGDLSARTPITGTQLRTVRQHSGREVDDAVDAAHRAFLTWRTVPAPARGAVVRSIAVSSAEEAQERFQVTILWSPDGERIYVAETGTDTIAEVDFATGKVLRRLSGGDGGDGLAILGGAR